MVFFSIFELTLKRTLKIINKTIHTHISVYRIEIEHYDSNNRESVFELGSIEHKF